MAGGPGVTKWTKIASALHSGALDHRDAFHTTQDAIDYLHAYQTPPSGADHADVARLCDFYYHPDKLKAPFRLGELFLPERVDRCRLCWGVTIGLDERGKFKYTTDPNASAVRSPSEELEPRDLARLTHLALMHTPYFLTLFLELVKNKRHVLHAQPDEAVDVAAHVYHVLKGDGVSRFAQERGFPFLKVWWLFQERRACRLLGLSIPCYLELQNASCRWTPKLNGFEMRKPEPLYSFISHRCLCHDAWPSGDAEYSRYTDLSPRVETVRRGRSRTFSVRILTPKLHSEAILESLVKSWHARENQTYGREPVECSRSMAPRLDCLLLEDVGHPQAVIVHVVVTLKSDWQSLTAWLSAAGDRELADERKKVSVGVLGALRDMCLANKRPPRKLYAGANELAALFFVHGETKEVLSLLPYVSIDRVHRSSNCSRDEDSFRYACANLTLLALGTRTAALFDETTMARWRACETHDKETLSLLSSLFDKTEGGAEARARIWNSLQFCKSGLTDDSAWKALNPGEFGSRSESGVDTLEVWLGETRRTPGTLRDELVAMNIKEPLRVSVLEVVDDVVARVMRVEEQHTERTMTSRPETHKGLVNAVTIHQSEGSTVSSRGEAQRGAGEPSDRRTAKRVKEIDGSCEVASKRSHENADASCALEYMWELVDGLQVSSSPVRNSPPPAENAFGHGEGEARFEHKTNTAIYADKDVETLRGGGEPSNLARWTAEGESFAGYQPSPPQYNHVDLFFLEKEDSSYNNGLGAVEPNGIYIYDTHGHQSEESYNHTMCLETLFESKYTDDMDTLRRIIRETNQCEEAEELLLLHRSNDETHDGERDDTRDRSECRDLGQIEQCEQKQTFDRSDSIESGAAGEPRPESAFGGPSSSKGVQSRGEEKNEERQWPAAYPERPTGGQSEQRSGRLSVTGAESGEDRDATLQERAFMNRNPRWKSNGFNPATLSEIQRVEYKTMIYQTPTDSGNAVRDTVVLRTKVGFEPISSPCETLYEPAGTPSTSADACVFASAVVRQQTSDRKLNEKLGIESFKRYGSQMLNFPEELKYYVRQVSRTTLNCREAPQRYCAVDLSQTPELGFRHVALEVNDFPVRSHEKPLVKIQSSQAMYLGAACTVQDASGLLCVRVFAKTCKILEDLLDMHTRLQLDPFAPRVFALHLMKVPFVHDAAVGVFVGESPGEWNLGSPRGMETLTRRDKFVLAHHVLKCLLRAQMLTLGALGFPLRCVQPARIWKRAGGFRVDLVSSLVDTFQKWFKSDNKGGPGTGYAIDRGVAAVRDTLRQLELLDHVPRETAAALNDNLGYREPDVFSRMYAALTKHEAVRPDGESHATLGSRRDYKKIKVETNQGPLEPFGPFRVQIHNQGFKWNKAIVVEPLTRETPGSFETAKEDEEEGLARMEFGIRDVRTLEDDSDRRPSKSACETVLIQLESTKDYDFWANLSVCSTFEQL